MRTRVFIVMACAVVAMSTALPATANQKPTTGTRIGLYFPPATFAANTPFYVEHGYACGLTDTACISQQINANAEFDLYIDGVRQPSTVDVDVASGAIIRQYLTNKPSGLSAGWHTFLGVWLLNGTVAQTKSANIDFT